MTLDIVSNIIIIVAIIFTIYAIIDIIKSFRVLKKLKLRIDNLSRYLWLIKTGMHEQAAWFNAFGLEKFDKT